METILNFLSSSFVQFVVGTNLNTYVYTMYMLFPHDDDNNYCWYVGTVNTDLGNNLNISYFKL